MPASTLQETKDEDDNDSFIYQDSELKLNACQKEQSPPTTRKSFVGLSPNKSTPSPTKTLSHKIKEETRKLVKYPGKALLKRSCPSEDSFNSVDDEVFVSEDFSAFFKEHDILMEYKYVCKAPPSGVYVVPSVKSLQVWHGIIFVRAGPFKEGVFRFDSLLPDNFPNSAPLVRFTSRVFHPQIHVNGVLNLEHAFPNWRKGEDHMLDVLKYVKSSFFNLHTWNALNEDAVKCIDNSVDVFKAKARECVEESLGKFYDESTVTAEDDGNILKVRPLELAVVNAWKQKLFDEDFPSP